MFKCNVTLENTHFKRKEKRKNRRNREKCFNLIEKGTTVAFFLYLEREKGGEAPSDFIKKNVQF
jgi:hypothetical protein